MAKSKNSKKKTSKKKKITRRSKLASVWKLSKSTASVLINDWRVLGLIATIHIAVSVLLAVVSGNYQSGQFEPLFVGVLFSLAYLWVLRESHNSNEVSAKEALYRGPAQFVPFILVALMFFVQMLPFAIGAFVFQVGVGGGVAINIYEQLVFGLIWLILALPSIYWVTTTTFALIIVSIGGVNPLQAWRAAKKLIKPYFMAAAGRLLYIFIIGTFLLFGALVLAIWLDQAYLFTYGLSVVGVLLVPVVWTYIFEVYRELLKHE